MRKLVPTTAGTAALLATVALVTPVAVVAQEPGALTAGEAARVAAVFADLDREGSPGASVAVVRDGEIVYSRGFGEAQIEHGVDVTPQTVFHVASVSKQFTAAAILLLEQDGRLSLDDDVRRHVPEVPDMGHVVTIRHLLHHTSGVRDQWELLALAGWRLDDVITKDHVRRLLANQRELNFEPGAEYLYSNMGYSLAADIVERVSGTSFADFTRERIFEPLGMTSTHVHDDHEHVVPGRAYSYRGGEAGYSNAVLSYANHGATSLFTTAEDLARWLDNYRRGRVLGAEGLARLQNRGVLNSGDTIGYALGVSVGDFRGARTVGHGGADAGFRSNVIWFPEHRTGVVVLSNLASANPGNRARRVAEVVLEGELAAPVEDPDTPPPAQPEARAVDVPVEVLARYEGSFETEEVVVTFEVREGALWLVQPETERLMATSATDFRTEDAARIAFHPTATRVDSLTAYVGGAALPGRRIDLEALGPMDAFVGTYYSPELETHYRVEAGSGGLSARHLRHGELTLLRTGEDLFRGNRWFFGRVRFTRDETGRVDGFRVTGGRVRNLRFVKLATPLPG